MSGIKVPPVEDPNKEDLSGDDDDDLIDEQQIRTLDEIELSSKALKAEIARIEDSVSKSKREEETYPVYVD